MGARRYAVVVALLCGALSGCYSYRGGKIPSIDPATLAVPRLERVIVANVKVESNTGGDTDLAGMATRQIDDALRNAGGDVKQSGAVADPDATLNVSFLARGDAFAQAISGFICGFTFGIVPGYASVDLRLEADVLARDGTRRQYSYYDTHSLWIEILLLPFSNSPDKVASDLIGDMARSLARDLQRDGILPPPQVTKTAWREEVGRERRSSMR